MLSAVNDMCVIVKSVSVGLDIYYRVKGLTAQCQPRCANTKGDLTLVGNVLTNIKNYIAAVNTTN